MKGDFSRVSFDPTRHYSAVLKQQGRVELDADANEGEAIREHIRRATTADVVGACGAPITGGGFEIGVTGTAAAPDLSISPGHIYVDGILCELEAQAAYNGQADFPNAPALSPVEGRTDLIYLDVWQRHITYVEDPALREVALGGPDTTTRVKTLWQVKVRQDVGNVTCAAADGLLPAPSGGFLTTDVVTPPPSVDPCSLAPAGGYQGLENRLYRVEVHEGGPMGGATFKWAYHNASLVFAVDEFVNGQPASELRLKSIGRDKVLALRVGDWVEALDDATELSGAPGTMAQVTEVDEAERTIKLSVALPVLDEAGHPKVRRWGQPSDAIAITPDPFELEPGVGVTVQFSGTDFISGDYWVFAARSATRDIERLTNAPPMGIHHRYCALALVTWNAPADPWQATVHDCRPRFPALTELTIMYYVSGDGQEAMPGVRLPKPLQVGVANGQWPVEGALVRFRAPTGNGRLVLENGSNPLAQRVVATNSQGVAEAFWRLDPNGAPSQQVEATLLDASGNEALDADGNPAHLRLRFNANLSIASQVAYDNPAGCLVAAPTVKDALDQLCQNFAIHYVSGDGQEAMPGEELPQPLQVRVTNGGFPLEGAEVVFRVALGTGAVQTTGAAGAEATATTDEAGLASCSWRLDAATPAQRVEAHYSEAEGLIIGFNANLSLASRVHYTPGCEELAGVSNVQDAIDALCQMTSPQEPGFHITDVLVSLASGQRERLLNDSVITPGILANGITVVCDQPPAAESVVSDQAVCFVTLELPYPLNQADLAFWDFGQPVPLLGYQPLKLAANAKPAEREILWQPVESTRLWLQQRIALLFDHMRRNNWGNRLLAHLTLKGNFIWAQADRELYLDGETLGVAGRAGTLLRLPSGDGKRGGDFEMWFWLALSPTRSGGVGFVARAGSSIEVVSGFTQAFNLAINRPALAQEGLLPTGYQVDASQPFNLSQARTRVAQLNLGSFPLRVLVGPNSSALADRVRQMLSAVGLTVQVFTVPDAAARLSVLRSGEADMMLTDEDEATRLAAEAPASFGGFIRI
jgi:hypothetical protein